MSPDPYVAHRRALEALRDALKGPFAAGEALESVRRLAESVRHVAEVRGDVDLVGRARALTDAPSTAVVEQIDRLLERLPGRNGSSGTDRRALVVEDDADAAVLLEAFLEAAGFETHLSASLSEARDALARGFDPDILVLDLMLPDGDGRAFLVELKRDPALRTIPVLVATARTGALVREECLALGATGFIEKPVSPAHLSDRLDALVHALEDREVESQLTDRGTWLARFDEAGSDDVALLVAADTPSEVGHLGEALHDALEPGEVILGRWGDREIIGLVCGRTPNEVTAALQGLADAPASPAFRAAVAAGGRKAAPEEAVAELSALLAQSGRPGSVRVVSPPDRGATARHRILVAEDDPVGAKLLTYRLTREPEFEVLHVDNGRSALDAIREGVDLAILDVQMPGMDGFELLARLRAGEAPDLPVMLITSLGSDRDIVRGLEMGADDYVIKPFSPGEVVARAHRLLRTRYA